MLICGFPYKLKSFPQKSLAVLLFFDIFPSVSTGLSSVSPKRITTVSISAACDCQSHPVEVSLFLAYCHTYVFSCLTPVFSFPWGQILSGSVPFLENKPSNYDSDRRRAVSGLQVMRGFQVSDCFWYFHFQPHPIISRSVVVGTCTSCEFLGKGFPHCLSFIFFVKSLTTHSSPFHLPNLSYLPFHVVSSAIYFCFFFPLLSFQSSLNRNRDNCICSAYYFKPEVDPFIFSI